MKKRFLSFFLSFVIAFTAVVYMNGPLSKTVHAAPGETLTDGSYTYVEEPPYTYYDENDPRQILLYSTSRIENYAASGSSVHLPTTCTTKGAIGGTGAVNGNFFFSSGKNNTSNISYGVIKTSTDTLANGVAANANEETFMKNWGITRMAWFQTTAKDGILSASGGTCYYFNLICKFNSAVDLSQMTHVYLDFWVSADYDKSVDGKLNVAFWDNAYNSEVDGFEFDVDFAHMRLDNGNPRTGHTYYLDLRELGQTSTQYGPTINLNSIDGVTLRYTSSSSSTQYTSTGKSPKIWLGKMIAMARTDNLQLAGNFADTSKDPSQGAIYTVTGDDRWNKTMNINFPIWNGKTANSAIVGLIVGDRGTGVDYYYDALDRASWRWRRPSASTANTDLSKSFPATPLYSTGGGNQGLPMDRNNSKYITAHGYKAYTVT